MRMSEDEVLARMVERAKRERRARWGRVREDEGTLLSLYHSCFHGKVWFRDCRAYS